MKNKIDMMDLLEAIANAVDVAKEEGAGECPGPRCKGCEYCQGEEAEGEQEGEEEGYSEGESEGEEEAPKRMSPKAKMIVITMLKKKKEKNGKKGSE